MTAIPKPLNGRRNEKIDVSVQLPKLECVKVSPKIDTLKQSMERGVAQKASRHTLPLEF